MKKQSSIILLLYIYSTIFAHSSMNEAKVTKIPQNSRKKQQKTHLIILNKINSNPTAIVLGGTVFIGIPAWIIYYLLNYNTKKNCDISSCSISSNDKKHVTTISSSSQQYNRSTINRQCNQGQRAEMRMIQIFKQYGIKHLDKLTDQDRQTIMQIDLDNLEADEDTKGAIYFQKLKIAQWNASNDNLYISN